MKRFLFLVLLPAWLGCDPTVNKPIDHKTSVFNYYLKNTFGDSIGKEKQTYVLIPTLGCKGCREEALDLLHREILASHRSDIIYIRSPAVKFPDSLAAPCRLLADKKGLLDKINIPISNISILKTGNYKVLSLVSVRSDTYDSIPFYIKEQVAGDK